jgi:hypothetical protein
MKNNLLRKSLALTIIALFSIIYIMPAIAGEPLNNENNSDIIIEYSIIDLDGSNYIEKITIPENELENIRNKLSNLFEDLQLQRNTDDTMNVLNSFINNNDYPILSRILSNLFRFDFMGKRKLVVSQGIGPNFNPLKDSKTAVVKPFTTWLYMDSNNLLPIPSATGVLSFNPFKIKNYMGPQFGFMLRFRGLYINIGQASNMQSYTFFIGTARHIGGFEFTPLSSLI